MPAEIQPTPTPIMKYSPQLDGLRFCAVLFVVSYHWLPVISHIPVASFFGGIVNFFFVLSSYLITKILFSARQKHITYGIPKIKMMGIFLLRRTIRIFPAYYFFLLLVLLLPTIGSEVRDNAGMYFSYLANYHIFNTQDFPSVTAHIWTLAVEEQFYLLWPFVILFIPHRHLLKTFVFIIVSSVVLRAICYSPSQGVPMAILTQYCVDAFAVGAILAYQSMAPDTEKKTITKYFNWVLLASIPVGIIIIVTKSYYLSFVFNRLLFSMLSLKIIEGAIDGYKNGFGKFLENKVVLYLGRISYGIYLYHLLIPVVFWKIYGFTMHYVKTSHAGFFLKHKKAISSFEKVLVSPAAGFIIYAVLVIIVASLSSKLLEKPINKLKASFNFDTTKATLPTTPIQRTIL